MLMIVAAAGSAALLLGAFGFQYLGGLVPCPLCIWQRWPHAGAAALGVVVLLWQPHRALAGLGAAAALAGAGLGLYHTGIERGWWPGPASCSGGGAGLGGLSGADLLDPTAAAPLVMCDEVAWSLAGLSMASWNALASAALAALWIVALLRMRAARI